LPEKNSAKKSYQGLMIAASIILIVTCLFLIDAFRRFADVSHFEQVIEKKTVYLNSIAFGLFALGVFILGAVGLVLAFTLFEKNTQDANLISALIIGKFAEGVYVVFFLANLFMAIILYKLIVK